MQHISDDFRDEQSAIDALTHAVFTRYGYDFRHYAKASLTRRLRYGMHTEGLETISALREKLMNDPNCMTRLIQTLSVNVTEMFRDPAFYRVFRDTVLPSLQALPFIRIWHAGAASGEEAYSMAILLMEEGLLNRTRIYATDINDIALQQARDGQYSLERMIEHNENYINAGCKRALPDYYKTQGDQAILHDDLKMKIIWAQHNLVTDASFNEFHVIICRNVLIYFDRTLQTRVHSLFYNSLIQLGWLGLGRKETLQFTAFETRYTEVDEREKWFRKV